jgi:ABC-type dipeptide/oligopeptide/nickel transport system permease subunit
MTPRSGRAAGPLGWGVALVGGLALVAICAPYLAPLPPERQLDPAVGRMLPPGTLRYVIEGLEGAVTLAEAVEAPGPGDPALRAPGGQTLRALRDGRWISIPTTEIRGLDANGMPARRLFLLGTDTFGRDVFSRFVHGARTSLSIGALAALVAVGVGVSLGAVAGFAGGWIDAVVMRLVDALLAFPRLFLVIALAALLDSTSSVLVLVLGLTGWMGAARLTRAEVRGLKGREFVEAAHAVGQRPRVILRRHLLPHALTPVVIDTALRVGDIILVEAALSFLGMGVRPPAPTWGNMVAEGATQLPAAWWISTLPGLAIAVTVIGLNLIADGLRDRLDPRRRSPSPSTEPAAKLAH